MAWRGKSLGAVEFTSSSPTDTVTANDWKREDACGGRVYGAPQASAPVLEEEKMVAVEFISVVLERWSFGRLLAELYWSFDINTWVNAPQNFEAHSKATCCQSLERSGM